MAVEQRVTRIVSVLNRASDISMGFPRELKLEGNRERERWSQLVKEGESESDEL